MGIAQTILSQLGGASFLRMMIGAKNFIAHDDALSFKFSNKGAGRPNYIKITLDPSDTYNIEFGRIWGFEYKAFETINGVYVENMREVIENRTGLFLSLT